MYSPSGVWPLDPITLACFDLHEECLRLNRQVDRVLDPSSN